MTDGRRISIVVVLPPRLLLLDLAGPLEVLRITGQVQDRVAFDMTYAAPQAVVQSSIGLSLSGAGPLPDVIEPGAVILVPGSADKALGAVSDPRADIEAQEQIVVWLRRSVQPGHLLVTVCEGAMLAARAGLLDGYTCTTHHESCDRLAALAPQARVLKNRLFVEDRDRLSSAGVTAGVDLMLHLISHWVGPAVAVAAARSLVIYMRRGPDDVQLSPWLEGRSHLHPVVHRAQDAIAADPARDWSMIELGRLVGASARNLSRLFSIHAGTTVTDSISRARLALARDLVERSHLGLEQIAEHAGFASARDMRRVWGRFYSTPPSAVRRAIDH